MKKWALWLGTLSLLTGGCEPQRYHADTPSVYESARSCAQVNQDNFYASDAYATSYLTVATGDPAYPPWWQGGTTREHPHWKLNDPYLGRGYEGAVTFEIAKRMGFRRDRVTFAPMRFDESFAPGPKPADFVVQQISSTPERERNVDFTEGYYDVRQALVSVRGSPIATVTSLDQLRDARLGASADTTSIGEIEHTIRPSTHPTVFDDLAATVRGLKDGRVDGIVVDLASASYIATVQLPNAVIVGRLPTSDPGEHFAMALVNGSPITQCVNIALQEMKDDGTLAKLRKRWLGGSTGAPLIEG
jgi:polar amino acid transport system substrate-binding protein